MTSSSHCENIALIVLLLLRWEFFKWSISTSYSYCRILNIYKYTIWLRFCVNVIKATGIIPMSLLENFFLLLFRTSIAIRPSRKCFSRHPVPQSEHFEVLFKLYIFYGSIKSYCPLLYQSPQASTPTIPLLHDISFDICYNFNCRHFCNNNFLFWCCCCSCCTFGFCISYYFLIQLIKNSCKRRTFYISSWNGSMVFI